MPDLSATSRPSQLWKQLSSERRLEAAEAFWRDDHAMAEQAEALALVAQRIKFRLKSVQAMSVERKARQLVSVPSLSETIAARLLVSYHLAHQRPMMAQFLDALEIAHDEGLITDEALTSPPADRLAAAASALAEAYPANDVALYFSTLLWQDPDTWSGLADLPQAGPASG